MRSRQKDKWIIDVKEELDALYKNGVWVVAVPPKDSHILHTKWVFRTKTDADGAIERYKARLVACGNEQLFGVDCGLTFAAVMELSITVKVILVFARRWEVSTKHEDIPNAYVKAYKNKDIEIYLRIPQGIELSDEVTKEHGVDNENALAFPLVKSLYG
ncbi:unnamed protein product [Peronospora belbahrii]|uniref:Reverse transcriptase Ty1/copia-type domain-containing protein n=1 Tax=Peronospora belbahrii TaxID=622444 RepID=A0ABN8CTE2_9STRA|nr:unnamed protein product [Peronospora belbahrii]